MELESTCAIMSDSMGKLLFYSNGCYIANASHQMMTNSDSLAHGLLESSFCNSGGNPLTQGMIALPKGKIYIAGIFHDHLHVINRPNCLGVSCDLEQYAIQMYWINSYTMPNTPQYKRWSESDTCVAVGTNEVISGDDITIFPNPVTEIINLKTETQFDNLRIFDITGRVISTFNQIPLEGKTSIDVHQLPPGLYFLQLQAGNKVWSKKFVKL